MLGIAHIPMFVATCLVVSATPGPATMYLLGRTIAQGRDAGVRSVLGISTGSLIHTVFASAGLSAILAASAAAFTAVKLLGAAYLVLLGFKALLSKHSLDAPTAKAEGSPYWQGVVTQTLNPKLAIFMVSFLPQFVAPGAKGPVPFLALGGLFVLLDTVWYLSMVWGAARATQAIRRNERAMSLIGRLAGVVYIALGLNLLRAKPAS